MQAAVSKIVNSPISLFHGTPIQKFVEVIVRIEMLLDKLNSLPSCLIPNHWCLVLDVSDGSVPLEVLITFGLQEVLITFGLLELLITFERELLKSAY